MELTPEVIQALGAQARSLGAWALGLILAAWVAVHLLDALKAKWSK